MNIEIRTTEKGFDVVKISEKIKNHFNQILVEFEIEENKIKTTYTSKENKLITRIYTFKSVNKENIKSIIDFIFDRIKNDIKEL